MCEALAAELGEPGKWALARRLAGKTLPWFFGPASPADGPGFPRRHFRNLEMLADGLPGELFRAEDGLGRVLGTWRSAGDASGSGNGAGVWFTGLQNAPRSAAGPREAHFLLDNTLGAWWASRRLSPGDLKSASSESELRRKASLKGVPLEYLRFVRDGAGVWKPAAGAFGGWPEDCSGLRLVDPCCGAGLFLAAAFNMLVPMRMELDGLSAGEAADAVLRENVCGLDHDRRSADFAMLALSLAAWKYPGAGGVRELPAISVACSGVPPDGPLTGRVSAAGGDGVSGRGLEKLYAAFGMSEKLGSLMEPAPVTGIFKRSSSFPNSVPNGEPSRKTVPESANSRGRSGRAANAASVLEAASLLSRRYTLVASAVPCLQKSKMKRRLRIFCGKHYRDSYEDLATVFIERCMRFCSDGGTAAVAAEVDWLNPSNFLAFRSRFLCRDKLNLVV
jgi:hypothetical protein